MIIVLLLGAACSSEMITNPGAASVGYEGYATSTKIKGYNGTCINITAEVSCDEHCVFVCCTDIDCVMGITGGFAWWCDEQNCENANEHVIDDCSLLNTIE